MQSAIDLRGDFLNTASYSMLAREIYYGLSSRLGMIVRLEHVPTGPVSLESEAEIKSQIQASQNIKPSPIKLHLGPPPYSIQPNHVNICWSLSNSCTPPEGLKDAWNKFNFVIHSSGKITEQLKKDVDPNKFGYFPFPVDLNMFNPNVPKISVLNVTHDMHSNPIGNTPYIIGACGFWHRRSGLQDLLRAYFTEFNAKDNVVLLLKTAGVDRGEGSDNAIKDRIAQIRNAVRNPSPPRIFLIPSVMSDNDYSQFISVCDAFISASHWDSLHPGLHHAMACDKVVIAPDYNKMNEICSEEMMITYPSIEEPAFEIADSYASFGERWFTPSIQGMMSSMRKAFNSAGNPDAFAKKRKKAKEYMEKICSADVVIQNLCETIASGVPIQDTHPEVYEQIKRGAEGAYA